MSAFKKSGLTVFGAGGMLGSSMLKSARKTPLKVSGYRRAELDICDEPGIRDAISGQDIVVRFDVKTTSSILSKRKTITKSGEETEIITKGRHDPCVGIRAVPVGEAMMACVILDHLLLHRGQIGENRGSIG